MKGICLSYLFSIVHRKYFNIPNDLTVDFYANSYLWEYN